MKKKVFLISLMFTLMFTAAACGIPADENRDSLNRAASPEPSATIKEQNSNDANEVKKEGHEHVAPHGGTLVAFGDEFAHLEIVLDASKGEMTAYALDAEAEESVRIAQESIVIEIEKPVKLSLILDAVENALTGEKRGATSEFRGQSEQLKKLNEFDAHVKAITIRGRQFKDVDFNFPTGNEQGHGH